MQFSMEQGQGSQWPNHHVQYQYGNYFDRDGAGDGHGQHVQEFPGGFHRRGGGFHPHHGRGRGGRGRGGQRGGGHPYNRSSSSGGGQNNNVGGHKPWMTPEILDAIKERNELQRKAAETNDPDDWSIFKAVRNRTSLLLNDARRLYEEKHGVGVTQNFNNMPPQQQQSWKSKSSSSFYCDTCDRSFATQELLNEHNAEHVTCKLDGCTFTAHPKVILKHIEMQHSNNLFSRVRGYDTPEDIEKWKAERRTRFPTADNIQKKQDELEERQKRGERLPLTDSEKFKRWKERRDERTAQIANAKQQRDERKFNNARGRGGRSHQPDQHRRTENHATDNKSVSDKPPQNVRSAEARSQNRYSENTTSSNSIIVLENFYAHVKVGENGALVGKKLVLWDGETQRMCQKIARTGLPMKNAEGASDSEESEGEAEEVDDEITDEDENDFEPQTVPLATIPSDPPTDTSVTSKLLQANSQESKTPKTVSGLGSLVNYSDDSESEDNEPPTELPIDARKEEGEIDDDNVTQPLPSVPPHQVPKVPAKAVVKSDAINPHNKRGKQQKERDGSGANNNNKSAVSSKITKKRRQPRMPKLLKKLLEDDIRRERNQILQVCRFIVQNNFFDEPSSSSSSSACPASAASSAGANTEKDHEPVNNTQD